MTEIPTLTTERLTLRAPEARDFGAYAAFYASERSVIIGGPRDASAAWKVLANDRGHWDLRGYGWWVLDDGTGAVGTLGSHRPEPRDVVEIGWSLFSATGRGYATEAGRAALAWANGRWADLVSYIDRENGPSQRVAARLGATDSGRQAEHDMGCTIWTYGGTA